MHERSRLAAALSALPLALLLFLPLSVLAQPLPLEPGEIVETRDDAIWSWRPDGSGWVAELRYAAQGEGLDAFSGACSGRDPDALLFVEQGAGGVDVGVRRLDVTTGLAQTLRSAGALVLAEAEVGACFLAREDGFDLVLGEPATQIERMDVATGAVQPIARLALSVVDLSDRSRTGCGLAVAGNSTAGAQLRSLDPSTSVVRELPVGAIESIVAAAFLPASRAGRCELAVAGSGASQERVSLVSWIPGDPATASVEPVPVQLGNDLTNGLEGLAPEALVRSFGIAPDFQQGGLERLLLVREPRPDGTLRIVGAQREPIAVGVELAATGVPAVFVPIDADDDRVGDGVDSCPDAPNPLQVDTDGDGRGDACECGDADGDGRVNTTDARLVQRAVVGDLARQQLFLCDATGDGVCDTSDARLIQRFAVDDLPKDSLVCAEGPAPGSL